MYLPSPLRKMREAIRQKQIQRDRRREFFSMGRALGGDPLSRTLHRMSQQSASETSAINAIERRRADLLKCTDNFQMLNLASDANPEGALQTYQVCEAATWSQGPVEAGFLFHLIRTIKPDHVLEMGTRVGISGSYAAAAMRLNGNGQLYTLEGSPETARIARATFASLGLADRVTLIEGPFRDTLSAALTNRTIGLAFVDGHHEGPATLRYFDMIRPHLAKGAVVWFDDIDWPSMVPAWQTLRADPIFSTTAQTKRTGLAVVA